MNRLMLFLGLYFGVFSSLKAQIEPELKVPGLFNPAQTTQELNQPGNPSSETFWAEGVVTGTVRKSDGSPVHRAFVTCAGKGAFTDEKGAYRINRIEAGAHFIAVSTCKLDPEAPNRCKDPGSAKIELSTIRWQSVPIKIDPAEPRKTQDFTAQ